MKKFEQGVLNTTEQNDVNSLIMEKASDIAGELTEQACKIKGITCFTDPDEDNDGMTSYTEEAQDMFNSFYDTKMDELYELVNSVQAVVEKQKKGYASEEEEGDAAIIITMRQSTIQVISMTPEKELLHEIRVAPKGAWDKIWEGIKSIKSIK